MAWALSQAPAPDFRYVGLEPITSPRLRVAGAALGLGAGVTLAMSSLDLRQAFLAGAVASVLSAVALRTGRAPAAAPVGSARMAIVPWGVLVEIDDTPRILRWAAVSKVEVETSPVRRWLSASAISTRVAIETEHDRFVGESRGTLPLERLIEHVSAYAGEQSTPIALDLAPADVFADVLVEEEERPSLDAIEPGFEMLLAAAGDFLGSAEGGARLGLEPGGYRSGGARAPTGLAVDVLGAVLRDRTPRRVDPRAFAAVLAAELHARQLVPELVALAQCPHPLVAAVARQAARKLGASRAQTGTLDEVAPFLFEADRIALDEWT